MYKRERRYIFGVPAFLINGAALVGGVGGVILAELRDFDFGTAFISTLFFAALLVVITVLIFRPQFAAQAEKNQKGKRRP